LATRGNPPFMSTWNEHKKLPVGSAGNFKSNFSSVSVAGEEGVRGRRSGSWLLVEWDRPQTYGVQKQRNFPKCSSCTDRQSGAGEPQVVSLCMLHDRRFGVRYRATAEISVAVCRDTPAS
jgi:hypothetical protein